MDSEIKDNTKSNDKLHYEQITKFLIWGIGVAGVLIVTIASVAIYLSYKDRDERRICYNHKRFERPDN